MNDLDQVVKCFMKIQDLLYEYQRNFVSTIKRDDISWDDMELYDKQINDYYREINLLVSNTNIDIVKMLSDTDSFIRLSSLKLIRDAFIPFSREKKVILLIIELSINGNDEEKVLAQNLILREKIDHKLLAECTCRVLTSLWNGIDYYLFKDIGNFLLMIENYQLLQDHLDKGKKINNRDIHELIIDFQKAIVV